MGELSVSRSHTAASCPKCGGKMVTIVVTAGGSPVRGCNRHVPSVVA